MAETSTKPYMIRALYEWCCDNGYTPYLAVAVDAHTIVPRQHVKGGEIVLNVSPMATSRLTLGNELVEFQARFSGVAQQISIPIANISAIYARETGHGMAFDVSKAPAAEEAEERRRAGDDEPSAGRGNADEAGNAARRAVPRCRRLRGDGRPQRRPTSAGGLAWRFGAGSRRTIGDRRSRLRLPDGRACRQFAQAFRQGARAVPTSSLSRPPGAAARRRVPARSPRTKPDERRRTATEVTGAEDDDDDPPPADGGGKSGKGGKARLTRVK